jgi:hypothetical protein
MSGVEGGLTNQPPLDSCIETNEVTANEAEQANGEYRCKCTTLPPPAPPSRHSKQCCKPYVRLYIVHYISLSLLSPIFML